MSLKEKISESGFGTGYHTVMNNASMIERVNCNEVAGIFSGLGSPQEIIGGVVAFIVLMIAFPMALAAYFNVSTDGWDSNTISIWNLLGFISVAGLVVGIAAIGYSKYKNR